MSFRTVYGVTKEQEVTPEWQARDIRSPFQKFLDWLREPNSAFLCSIVLTAGAWLYPTLIPIILPVMLVLMLIAIGSKETAPLKIPIQMGLTDSNEIDPATRKPSRAKGIFFLGNEMRTNKELWLTNSDCRQHFLVLGTTGAGKTEALIGFGANALSWSSGFLFCDGKGDVALMAKVYAMLRRFGREDDLLVLNFMNDASSVEPGRINTNSINPFATGSADELTQMMVSLMDEVGGDGAMWKGRAVAMLTGVLRALVEKRDKGLLDLNVGEIRKHMTLTEIEKLAKDKDLTHSTRGAIEAYLKSLPGYKENPGDKGQAQTTLDQHGYLQMQFTKILGNLTDVYGHIFSTPYGEVDIADVVLNRRILVIMLPALKKSGDEINNLGKIVVANLKGMMGNVLGSTIDGRYEDIVEKRVTNAPSPFIVVLDEVGYYTVDGMAVMAAQARSLGFSLVFASQDIPAMKRRNEKEADSIIANTNVKIIMRLEDPGATAKLAIDRGDKALRVRVAGFERQVGETSLNYVQNAAANFEETSRISLRDLASQKDGEMHVLFQDKIIRSRSFFANPEGTLEKSKLRPRPNHFIRIPRPASDAHAIDPELEKLLERITKTNKNGQNLLVEQLKKEEQNLLESLNNRLNAKETAAIITNEFLKIHEKKNGNAGTSNARTASDMTTACMAIARLAEREKLDAQTPEADQTSNQKTEPAGTGAAGTGITTNTPTEPHDIEIRANGSNSDRHVIDNRISERIRDFARKANLGLQDKEQDEDPTYIDQIVDQNKRSDAAETATTEKTYNLFEELDDLDKFGKPVPSMEEPEIQEQETEDQNITTNMAATKKENTKENYIIRNSEIIRIVMGEYQDEYEDDEE